MKVLLTGGAGDLGTIVSADLLSRAYTPVILDVRNPSTEGVTFIEGSILDRALLESLLEEIDCVVHIAAWHGIHEFRQEKDEFDFWQLNVTGTFTLLECSARARCSKFIYISSTSVDDWPGIYAHSKILGEDLVRTYAARHKMQTITLRPRAFIPPWNRHAYADFTQWAQWFWKGAVHVNDVAQSVAKSIDRLEQSPSDYASDQVPPLTIDGACEFSTEEMESWDKDGPGSTFRARFGDERYKICCAAGLDPSAKPKIIGYEQAKKQIGYEPNYGFSHMIEELSRHMALPLDAHTSKT